MNRFVIPMVAVAFLAAACGTASGSTGSAGTSQAAIAGDHVQVNAANAASNVSEVTSRQDSGDRTATKFVTAPAIAQTVPPAANVLPPGERTGCGSDAGSGKVRPMCPPE
jgi:hypothetical protein